MTIKLFDNEINLEEIFDKINSEHFNCKINKIPCVWNKRLRVCAGKCFYTKKINKISLDYFKVQSMYELTPTKIELSYKLFENNNWDMEKIYTTMAHEMTHAYLLQEYNESGHTQNFQDIMTRITGIDKNHRCHSYNVDGLRNKRKAYFICECGQTEGYRMRMPNKGQSYTARCCGGKVYFSKVVDKEEVKSVANNTNDKGDDGFVPLF